MRFLSSLYQMIEWFQSFKRHVYSQTDFLSDKPVVDLPCLADSGMRAMREYCFVSAGKSVHMPLRKTHAYRICVCLREKVIHLQTIMNFPLPNKQGRMWLRLHELWEITSSRGRSGARDFIKTKISRRLIARHAITGAQHLCSWRERAHLHISTTCKPFNFKKWPARFLDLAFQVKFTHTDLWVTCKLLLFGIYKRERKMRRKGLWGKFRAAR